MKTSIIIPTYNRKEYLLDCLESLARQSHPAESFEVIVVNDGSSDGTEEIATRQFPFTLRYLSQSNQGDAAARNLGAQQSQGEFLVFLDDDMVVEPDYLACLLAEHELPGRKIVIGTEHLWLADSSPLDVGSHPAPESVDGCPSSVEHPFAEVFSRNMSIRQDDFFTVGLMDGFGFRGSNIWCDVDFAYRACRQGFEFRRSLRAICYHRDYVARDLRDAKRRSWTMAYRAVVMFQKHPELLPHLPMFADKTPIAWQQNPPSLIARKMIRPVASSPVALTAMEQIVHIIERRYPSTRLLRPLRRWILGGYQFRGFRQGLRDFTPDSGRESVKPA